MGQGTDEIID